LSHFGTVPFWYTQGAINGHRAHPNLCRYLTLRHTLVGKLLNLLVALHLGCLGCEAVFMLRPCDPAVR
tara:strand:+ start:5996 stop:6199 length:204 start_codon:yes stop_codon:yes gene_type:complete